MIGEHLTVIASIASELDRYDEYLYPSPFLRVGT